MGSKLNENVEIKFRDVDWLVVDGSEAKPVIYNKEMNKMKCILTGQIISGHCEDFDFDFKTTCSREEELKKQSELVKFDLGCRTFSLGSFESLYAGFLHYMRENISLIDIMKSRIAQDFFTEKFESTDPNFNMYTLKDYQAFTKIINKEIARQNKKNKKEKEHLIKIAAELQEQDDFFKF